MDEVSVPVAHVDDPSAISALLVALRELHGPTYEFAVGQWSGDVHIIAPPGAVLFRFLMETDGAAIALHPEDRVHGGADDGNYRPIEESMAEVTVDHCASLWPGDVVTATAEQAVVLSGSGRYFEVTVEETAYCAPRAAFLRNLADHPGGVLPIPGRFVARRFRHNGPPKRPATNGASTASTNIRSTCASTANHRPFVTTTGPLPLVKAKR